MEGGLLIVVLTSVFLLQTGADIPIHPNFDIQQMAGKWYPIALILDKAELSPESNSAHQELAPLENGDLLFQYTFVMEEGECEVHQFTFEHTDEPGKFTSQDGTSTLRVVDVNYDSYYILHAGMGNAAVLLLYTRKQEEISEEKEKFKKVAQSIGFNIDQTQFLKRSAACPGGDSRHVRLKDVSFGGQLTGSYT